jgi:hypothetical protein
MNQFIIFDPAGAGVRDRGGTLLSVDMIGGPAVLDFDGAGTNALCIPLSTSDKAYMYVEYVDASGSPSVAIAQAALETINNAVYRGIPGVGTIPVVGVTQSIEYTEA